MTAVALVTDRDKKTASSIPPPLVPRQCRHRQAGRSLLPFVSVTSASCTSTRVNEMEGGVRPNSALHPAASSRTRQRRSGHVLCSRYPRSSPGSWSPTKKKQALTASSPIVGLARIDLAQSLAMHVTSRSRQCHLMVRCELGHGRGSVCQSWMRPDHLTISPSSDRSRRRICHGLLPFAISSSP